MYSVEDGLQGLGRRVASKLEEGDFRGAVRLACSDDRLAPSDSATFAALQAKHPSSHCDAVIPPSPIPCRLRLGQSPMLSGHSLVGQLMSSIVCVLNTSRTSCRLMGMRAPFSPSLWPHFVPWCWKGECGLSFLVHRWRPWRRNQGECVQSQCIQLCPCTTLSQRTSAMMLQRRKSSSLHFQVP